MQVSTATIGGKVFSIGHIPSSKAVVLDTRVVRCLAPVFKMIGIFNKAPSGSVQFSVNTDMFAGLEHLIGEMLSGEKAAEFTALVMELVEYAIYCPAGQPSVEVKGNVDVVFQDGPMELYKLAFEVAKANKFSPFALLVGGSQAPITG